MRGHNLVVLDDSGNFVTSASFDTGDASRDEGSAMARFLDGLPNERIVLIATQDTKCKTKCITCGNCYHFRLKNGNNFVHNTKT